MPDGFQDSYFSRNQILRSLGGQSFTSERARRQILWFGKVCPPNLFNVLLFDDFDGKIVGCATARKCGSRRRRGATHAYSVRAIFQQLFITDCAQSQQYQGRTT